MPSEYRTLIIVYRTIACTQSWLWLYVSLNPIRVNFNMIIQIFLNYEILDRYLHFISQNILTFKTHFFFRLLIRFAIGGENKS